MPCLVQCLKKPCHRIWSITLSGGRLGAEGTCNFQVEWWDWLAAHFLSCDPGPASYCTPCTKWSSISAQWRRPFCARLFPLTHRSTYNGGGKNSQIRSFSIWIPLPHESPLFEYCDCNIDTSSSPAVEFTEFWKWSLIFYDDRGFSSISHGICK